MGRVGTGRRNRRTVALAAAAVIVLSSFNYGPDRDSVAIQEYLRTRETRSASFAIVERAADTIHASQGDDAYVAFLLDHVAGVPEDPATGYYLMQVGRTYHETGATEVARDYYRRALYAWPDVEIRGQSVHLVAMNLLLEIASDPRERIAILHSLQDRFASESDRGVVAWYLGREYERVGRWEEAYESYRVFLASSDARIPGNPDARRATEQRVSFYDSRRNWTMRNLDDLVREITYALYTQNPAALLRWRAGDRFFTMSWQQEEADANSEIPTFDIGAFLRRSRVRFADELDLASNATEAYLRTWGWSHRIPTWYLYFRRVDFPADPEIHGNWEWAGIFFGETR